ncbi:restriction endonuclease subunit S [Endozoicomonas sp. 4G]|uniref:restriction endonuclease subunit S n=1 Tax=Endozoicomonas sp. 4G TaxID=2872754 RepID=UPI002078B0BF|nr:restriction endonuclease subunit S [Endozoicomonas sp. 4G]
MSVIQIRNLLPDTGGINWPALAHTELTGRKKPDWLTEGDILFVMRGQNNIAVCLHNTPEQTVCSPHFFHLRVKKTDQLLPEFLAWQINQQPCQRYLQKGREGSVQSSVRRGVLEAMEISVPPMALQKKVMAMVEAAHQERQVLKRMIDNRERQLNQIANNILNTQYDIRGEDNND